MSQTVGEKDVLGNVHVDSPKLWANFRRNLEMDKRLTHEVQKYGDSAYSPIMGKLPK